MLISDLDIPVRMDYSMEVKAPLNSIKLPLSLLSKDNEVLVVNKDNKVEKRDITIDKVNGEIFVKKGLKKGDKLIKNPKKQRMMETKLRRNHDRTCRYQSTLQKW